MAFVDIIGIDEAGRGPLAGPVVVAGVAMAPRLAALALAGIKDSKQLSAKQRDEWFDFLTCHPHIKWAVSRISPGVIDRVNIYRAAQRGALQAYKKLSMLPPQPLLAKEGKGEVVFLVAQRIQHCLAPRDDRGIWEVRDTSEIIFLRLISHLPNYFIFGRMWI